MASLLDNILSLFVGGIVLMLMATISGAVDFMSKPLSPKFLLSKVNVFIDLYKASRSCKSL